MTIRNRGIRGVYMETNTSVYGVLGAEASSLAVRGGYLSQILTFPYTTVNAQVLIVAGGGGGGYDASGGGGAGGLYYSNNLSISNTNYTVTIGAGGTGGISGAVIGKSGSNTTFGSYTVIGGGGGAGATGTGANGGSGGGGGGWDGGVSVGGSSIQNTTFGYGVGNAGGTGGSNANWPAGGGGGAGARGANSSGISAGAGGNGLAYNFANGTSVYYAGGGGGGGSDGSIGGTGGLGGGGAGIGSYSALSGYTGSAGTGGGGGGSGHLANGGAGGSGIAIISYPIPQQFSGGVVTNLNGTNVVHTFTTSGSLNALATPIDTYFPQTTLLLHGDGTNGANNTVFVDSSTNALTITTNGKPQQGTFSPFSQTGWSNYFDGSGDYFTTSTSTSGFSFGTGDFTIEFWINSTQTTRADPVGQGSLYTGGGWWGFIFNVSSSGDMAWYENGNSRISASGTGWNNGKWNHVALTRSGNSVKMFLNGTQVGSTYTTSFTYGASSVGIISGRIYNEATGELAGYISNLRIVKGTAVYTSNFTPPTTSLTAISGTSLLTCQDNRFKDNSTEALTVTPAGNASVRPFSPLAPSVAYSNTTVGGSAYFNGSSDYLNIGSSSNIDNFTGDFCIEAWIYPTVTASDNNIIARWTTGNRSYRMYMTGTTNYIRIRYNNDTINLDSTTAVALNTWNHVVANRSGSTFTLFLNGVSVSTATSASTIGPNSINTLIGATESASPQAFFNGYISNVRIVKGSSVYGTSNFTPPTAPLTAVSNTQFLLSSTNAGIIDHTAKNTLTTYGSAAISSTQSKFGGTSMFFNGTTDYLQIPASPNIPLLGDFTVECWIYPTTLNAANMILGSDNGASSDYLNITSSVVQLAVSAAATPNYPTWNHTFTTNQWYHIAIVRQSGTLYCYVNGQIKTLSSGSASESRQWFISNVGLQVGRYGYSVTPYYFSGYIDELRISRYTRYTTNFTPPTSTFLDR